jgi:hypothetical protein
MGLASLDILERHTPHGTAAAVFGTSARLRPGALPFGILIIHEHPDDLVQAECPVHRQVVRRAAMLPQKAADFRRVPQIHRQTVHRLAIQDGKYAFTWIHCVRSP